MIDCFLIGYNEMDFEEYENTIRKMGVESGAYRDLNKSFIRYNNKPLTISDTFNLFICKDASSKNLYRPLTQETILSSTIAYLGTFLQKRGLKFDYINSFQDEKSVLAKKLLNNEILTIGITTTLYTTVIPILEIVDFIRKYSSKSKIIIGGPYILNQVKSLDKETLKNLMNSINADFYIYSDQGEKALCEIINAVKNDQSFDLINNIYYKDNNEYKSTAVVREDNRLSENMVKWDLFSEKIGEYISLRTSISCPFSCAYCGFPENAGQYQTIDVPTIESELNALNKIGTVKSVSFIDDTFNIPIKRFKEILRMLVRNKYNFKWHSFYRCQYADRETVELMKESGCEGVFLGLESGNDQILKNMNKYATIEKYVKGIELLREYDITTFGSFIIGFPGETVETFQDTMEFIKQSQIDFYRAQLWYCDPLTPIYKQREKYDIVGERFEWKHRTMDSRTACDLIDKMFVSIKESIWVPQYNFDFTNIWRLLHCGLSFEQMKTFLRAFNSGIKDELINETHDEVSYQVLRDIKQTCINKLDYEVNIVQASEVAFDFE